MRILSVFGKLQGILDRLSSGKNAQDEQASELLNRSLDLKDFHLEHPNSDNTMCNHKTRRLLESNSNVGHFSNKDLL